MRILVTGAAGLIGSQFCNYLVRTEGRNPMVEEVHGIDDLSGGYIENLDPKVIFYKIDLKKYSEVEILFMEIKPDIVYHFAAYAAEGLSPFIRKFNYETNLVTTTNIVNLCIKNDVNRLIFTSSMAVYGVGSPPFEESHKPDPVDPYGISKYACEMDIRIAGEQHGLDWCVIRPHNVYGEGQNIWDPYRNCLGIWAYQLMKGEDITIYGDGEQRRAFTYIGDIMEPLWRAGTDLSASKQVINLGGLKDTSINEAASILINTAKKGAKIHLEARHEVKHAYCTGKKSIDLLGYEDTTTLAEGLARMWKWASEQTERERVKWDSYELEKGLYSYWNVGGDFVVGIVIIFHEGENRKNASNLLHSLLDSLAENAGFPYIVYVIDNQSDPRPSVPAMERNTGKCVGIDYTYVEDQYASGGLSGGWNMGISKAHMDGCQVILAINDDLRVDRSINNMVKSIWNHPLRDKALFGPVTNGISTVCNWISCRLAYGHNPYVMDNALKSSSAPTHRSLTGMFGGVSGKNPQHYESNPELGLMDVTGAYELNGFFTGFTWKFFDKYRIGDGLFRHSDKRFTWGGQEQELQLRLWNEGVRSYIVRSCWVEHDKLEQWATADKIEKKQSTRREIGPWEWMEASNRRAAIVVCKPSPAAKLELPHLKMDIVPGPSGSVAFTGRNVLDMVCLHDSTDNIETIDRVYGWKYLGMDLNALRSNSPECLEFSKLRHEFGKKFPEYELVVMLETTLPLCMNLLRKLAEVFDGFCTSKDPIIVGKLDDHPRPLIWFRQSDKKIGKVIGEVLSSFHAV